MSFLCRAALVIAAVSCLPSTAAAASDEPPRRHSIGVSGGGGLFVASKEYYDDTFRMLRAGRVGVDYEYRVTPNLRVGLEGAGLFLFGRERAAATLWTASPTLGLHWGDGTIQGGVRLGVGAVYGTRFTREHAPGTGATADLMGELAWVGSRFDVVGRAGFRYITMWWHEDPKTAFYEDEFYGLGFVATLGVRVKL